MPRKMEPKRLCYLKSRVFDPSFLYEFLALGKPELSTVKFPPGSPYHYVTKNLRPYRTLVIFLGTPGFWKHHLAGHITIWWLRLKLLFRNQIYDTDLCFLLIIINKERWRILSKLYFGLQFPHFPTWLCKKKRAARPWGPQFQPFYRHPPSFEAWDDGGLLLWLAGSSYVQWEAGGSHLTLADENLSHRNETWFVGGFNKHQRWSRNMMGENKQQASSRMGIYPPVV